MSKSATLYLTVTATAMTAALCLAALTAGVFAQSPEPRKVVRIDDLMAQGFEIKALMPSPTGPRLILQSGARIYNCDGYKLGTDVPPTPPAPGIGLDRTLCFAVEFR